MIIHFDPFALDTERRQVHREGAVIELSSRYFDALALLLAEPGALVPKRRFHDEVWRGVPVTDEALTQCIATLRRTLGDSATQPRFIETVPKHGYRFVGAVGECATQQATGVSGPMPTALAMAGGGTIGGGLAGLCGGLLYGFIGASHGLAPGMGTISVLLVLTAISVFVALLGAAGVSAGVAATSLALRPSWLASGGFRRGIMGAVALGGIAGAGVVALGVRMLAGSLDVLARSSPDAHLRIDFFGDDRLGMVSHTPAGALEGAIFTGAVVAAIMLARRDGSVG